MIKVTKNFFNTKRYSVIYPSGNEQRFSTAKQALDFATNNNSKNLQILNLIEKVESKPKFNKNWQ